MCVPWADLSAVYWQYALLSDFVKGYRVLRHIVHNLHLDATRKKCAARWLLN